MLRDLIPAVVATVVPALLLLAVAYPLRPQYGRLRPNPRPARRILAHCAVDREQGVIPADEWGDVSRPSLWTVPVGAIVGAPIAVLSTDRDMTGAFPVVAVA